MTPSLWLEYALPQSAFLLAGQCETPDGRVIEHRPKVNKPVNGGKSSLRFPYGVIGQRRKCVRNEERRLPLYFEIDRF